MSLTQYTQRATTAPPGQSHTICRCEHCQGHYPLSYGFNRRFCRRHHKYLSIADARFADIRHDHKYCSSCFRKLKEVEPPTLSRKGAERGRSIPSCATGRQVYDEHVLRDFRNASPTHNPEESGRPYASLDLRSRMTCSCPANHHATVLESLPDVEWTKQEAIKHTCRLADTLDALDDQGVHTTDYDRDVLFGFVRKAKTKPSEQGRDDREVLRNGLALAIREAP